MRKKKKKSQGEHHVDESWLIPYSDLLTLLLALFVVLFAMSQIDAQKYEQLRRVFESEFSGGKGILEENISPVEPDIDPTKDEPEEDEEPNDSELELNQLQTLQKQINERIENTNLADAIGTKLTNEGLFISIFNDLSFDPGSAEVSKKGHEIARSISDFLILDPPHEIMINGHTDDRPIHNAKFASNWDLSVMRAVNFMRILLENEKLDPERFSAKGYGEFKPIAPNDSDENRAKNRRVEVLILPNFEIDTEQEE